MAVGPALSTVSLETLQSSDARKVMDIVDKLRKTGLGAIVQLPQICVAGDQSSGKSSVLEALTGIPFPRKENLCTRYATEIILRRANTESVNVNIIPDKLRPKEEQTTLKNFTVALTDFSKLGDLMEEVTKAMGLGEVGQATPRAFSRDVLSIEISGPSRPHLTLVDLPGLIHSGNKQQSKDDVETVKALVEDYIKEQRTIVLAVVSAKNDYANQIILAKARDLSAEARTLGVITKPDYLEAGSDNERSWLSLAQNEDVHFGLGWHMLKNRSEKEMSLSLAERDQNETAFFSRGSYRQLHQDTLELPQLQKELNEKYKETMAALAITGQSRSTPKDQRQYLMELGQTFSLLARAAIDGHYEDDFFGKADADRPIGHAANISRLRAVIQHANLQFASQMRQFGAKYVLREVPQEMQELRTEDAEEGKLDQEYIYAEDLQMEHHTKDDAIKWVVNIIQRSRGRELPGNFNPMLISQLFKEQSEHWQELAYTHVRRVAAYCMTFAKVLLKSITTSDIFDKIMMYKVEPALERRTQDARSQLSAILQDKNGHPITYNHYYTTTVQKIRAQRYAKKISQFAKQCDPDYNDSDGEVQIDLAALVAAAAAGSIEDDMDRFSAEDALTSQMAYYKDELKYFVNCVTKQVIERCLIHNLGKDIISALDFGQMSDEHVRTLAAEPKSIVQEREALEKLKAVLEAGQEAFKAALGAF